MEAKRNSISGGILPLKTNISGGNVPLREPSTGIYNALDEVEVELFPEVEIQELGLDLQEIEVEVLEFELI